MQEALPYRTWPPASTGGPSLAGDGVIAGGGVIDGVKSVKNLVSENAVIVFGRRGCCMCHVVKRLLQGLGVNPTVFEVDEEEEGAVVDELLKIMGVEEGKKDSRPQFPAVFVGGKLFGGLDRVMSTHISGELVPILKEAGALWL
ncbi:hypothetical protein L1049_010088 [Liquidambar formosana]|uniref:Glutaredoxin domain-containing protein n=1 Tax=Liquidambar formosana TaxID=63359 RepID=A0AAP0R1H2_LIQFO